jgi:hypothetical protein
MFRSFSHKYLHYEVCVSHLSLKMKQTSTKNAEGILLLIGIDKTRWQLFITLPYRTYKINTDIIF